MVIFLEKVLWGSGYNARPDRPYDDVQVLSEFKKTKNKKQIKKHKQTKKEEEKETFEELLSLVFWKRVALNHDAQLEVRMFVF